jgi:hypothetical protein
MGSGQKKSAQAIAWALKTNYGGESSFLLGRYACVTTPNVKFDFNQALKSIIIARK